MIEYEIPSALSIGCVSDPSTSVWADSIMHLSRVIDVILGETVSPLNVNVVYHLSGTLFQPEFEGVRTGRFNTRDKHLMVQAAVTPSPEKDVWTELLRLLRDAISEAEVYARKRRIADDLHEIWGIIDLIPTEEPAE